MVSHNRMVSISLLFAYSFATWVIVFLIRPTYSSSNRKEVFNFQKPGPLGFALFAHLALASILRVYKYLLSKQWFHTVSGPFLQIKSVNIHMWNIFLIENLPIKSQAFLIGRLFCVGEALRYNIPLAGLFQKHVGLRDKIPKIFRVFGQDVSYGSIMKAYVL